LTARTWFALPIVVNPVPPFVVGTVGNLSDAKVPEAFKDVKVLHLKRLN
jgi:hypothetical protein